MTERTLFLSYDGLSDPLGGSQILPYMIGLRQAGYRVTIISSEKPANLRKAGGRAHLGRRIRDLGLDWHPLSYHKNPPVLSTVYDIWRMNRTAARLHRQDPFAIIHCRSYPPALAGAPLCGGPAGPKFLFDMRGLWADERVDGDIWKLSNPLYKAIYRFFKKKERQFLLQADATVALTEAARTEIESWFSTGEHSPIHVIPCCCDEQLFDPEKVQPGEVQALRSELGLSADDYTLGYLGSLGTWYLLDEMLLFFRRLLQERPDAKFLLITNDPDEKLFGRAEDLGISRAALRVTSLPRQRIPAALMLVSLGISFIKPAYSKIASSPTKLAEMLCMGVPVVCNAGVGDAGYLHAHYDIGPLLADFSDQEYEAALRHLPPTGEAARTARRASALEYFSLERAQKAYCGIYRQLTT